MELQKTGEIVAYYGLIEDCIKEGCKTAWDLKNIRVLFPEGFWAVLNGVRVQFESDSNPDLLYRDYKRAVAGYIDGPVGPYPKVTLSAEDLENDARKYEEAEARAAVRAEEWRKKAEEAKRKLAATLERCPPMEVFDAESWQRSKDAQTDDYGQYVIRFAENWARLMQKSIGNGATLQDCAEELSRVADDEGLTGYQYGCAVGVLGLCWVHGEELRRWHNKATQIGTEGDEANEKGTTLNPALMTFSS